MIIFFIIHGRSLIRDKLCDEETFFVKLKKMMIENKMKIKIYKLFFLVLVFTMLFNSVYAETEQEQEYKVKAAFLYNFLKFIDWPPTKISDEKTINIGIIGTNPFGKAFEPVLDKKIDDKNIAIKLFNSTEQSKLTSEQIDSIKKCHVLFVCGSEKKQFKEILYLVNENNILTVGDTIGFLDAGGIINFMIEDQKVCFKINNYNAKQAKLNIRSQLLRLAKKVIEEKNEGENKS